MHHIGWEWCRLGKAMSQVDLVALSRVLGDTDQGFTRSELESMLRQCQFEIPQEKVLSHGRVYEVRPSKKKFLLGCFHAELNKSNNYDKIRSFIEFALRPANFIDADKREHRRWLVNEVNRVLMLSGLMVGHDGKITRVPKAGSLDEVDRRVNRLDQALYHRAIHHEVRKYCIADYLRQDYYDTVFEAAKGLAERIREISGLTMDGNKLFQTAFSTRDPYICINSLRTDSELSEHRGLRSLLESVFLLIRNPAAHTPKINWKSDLTYALDVLTLISFAHKYLDESFIVPRNN